MVTAKASVKKNNKKISAILKIKFFLKKHSFEQFPITDLYNQCAISDINTVDIFIKYLQ